MSVYLYDVKMGGCFLHANKANKLSRVKSTIQIMYKHYVRTQAYWAMQKSTQSAKS